MVVESLDQAASILGDFSPRKKWFRRFCKRSAVAVILREADNGLEALMIKRAERKGDPWSGHMAFPGGVADGVDPHNLGTARRETWEEIGLDTEKHTEYLGRLSDILSRPHRGRKPMVITPYIFSIDQVPALSPNHEVAEVIWVPMEFLADRGNREKMQWKLKRTTLNLPCYFYRERRIWGLSLMMLDELIRLIKVK